MMTTQSALPVATMNPSAVSRQPSAGQPSATQQAAQDFEAMFLTEMLNHMFSGLEGDPLGGSKEDQEIYQAMMAQEYAKSIARSGGIGIADYVAREMLKSQETALEGANL